ncbi:glycosyltransferase family 25 protein [Mesorhizobium sp. ORM6]
MTFLISLPYKFSSKKQQTLPLPVLEPSRYPCEIVIFQIMKRLVINLDRSPDRLAHMTAEFARIGIGFERVAAIDARQHPGLMLQPQHPLYAVRRLSGSEIACLHSHRACWTIIAQDEAPYGAVFEDDMVFSARAGALLADTSWIPPMPMSSSSRPSSTPP